MMETADKLSVPHAVELQVIAQRFARLLYVVSLDYATIQQDLLPVMHQIVHNLVTLVTLPELLAEETQNVELYSARIVT